MVFQLEPLYAPAWNISARGENTVWDFCKGCQVEGSIVTVAPVVVVLVAAGGLETSLTPRLVRIAVAPTEVLVPPLVLPLFPPLLLVGIWQLVIRTARGITRNRACEIALLILRFLD
jgi:hypothetical protein